MVRWFQWVVMAWILLGGGVGFAQEEVLFRTPSAQLVFLRPDAGNQGLTLDWKPIAGLVYRYTVEQPSVVTVYGHVGLQHFQENGRMTMVALNLWGDQDKAIKGFVQSTNLDPLRHYEDMPIFGSFVVGPGDHVLKVVGRLALNENGGVFVKDPGYSGLWVRIEPIPPSGN